jgi:hypothetical protein
MHRVTISGGLAVSATGEHSRALAGDSDAYVLAGQNAKI